MKWAGLPYRTKSFYLAAAFVLLLLLSYTFSVRKTIALYAANASIAHQLKNAENAPERIARLTHEISTWETTTVSPVSSEELQIRLFDKVSHSVEEFTVHLAGLKEVESFSDKDFDMRVYEVSVHGSYASLVQFIHGLENNLDIGKVISAKFELVLDRQSRKEMLVAKVYVQSILKHST